MLTPVHLRSLMAFPAQYLAIAPSVAQAAGVRAMETLGIVGCGQVMRREDCDSRGCRQTKGGC